MAKQIGWASSSCDIPRLRRRLRSASPNASSGVLGLRSAAECFAIRQHDFFTAEYFATEYTHHRVSKVNSNPAFQNSHKTDPGPPFSGSALMSSSQPPYPSAEVKQLAIPHRQSKVLVIDKERVIADTLVIILNQNGFDAVQAYTGIEAVEQARSMRPDQIICEVILPDINGIEAAMQICELFPSCRILLFCGHPATADLLEIARAKGQEFELVRKPIHPNALLHWCSVEGKHDVRRCGWCKEQRAISGDAFPHGEQCDSCNCTWCQGLGNTPGTPKERTRAGDVQGHAIEGLRGRPQPPQSNNVAAYAVGVVASVIALAFLIQTVLPHSWFNVAITTLGIWAFCAPFAYKSRREKGAGHTGAAFSAALLFIVIGLWIGGAGNVLRGVGLVIDKPAEYCGPGCVEEGEGHWAHPRVQSLTLGLGLMAAGWIVGKATEKLGKV